MTTRQWIVLAGALCILGVPATSQGLSFQRSTTIENVASVADVFAGQVLTLVDVDHDGRLDLVAVDDFDTVVKIYLGDGGGRLADPVEIDVGVEPTAVVAADLLGRGRTDLVVVSDFDETATILLQEAAPLQFEQHVLENVLFAPSAVAVADFSSPADGLLDLAVAGEDASGEMITVNLFRNRGDGTFVPFPTPSVSSAGFAPNSIVAGDFNGDGHSDLAVAGMSLSGGGRLIQLVDSGDGAFTSRGALSLGATADPRTLVQADFDSDGHLDLATVNADSQVENAFLLLLGQGNGTFRLRQTPSEALVEVFPVSLATADFNLDGYPDVVTIHGLESGIGNLSLLLSSAESGYGGLQRAQARGLELGREQAAVTTGDVNGDGRPDIAVLLFDGSVRILVNLEDEPTPTATAMDTPTLTPTATATRTATPSSTATSTSAATGGGGCNSSGRDGAPLVLPSALLLALLLRRRRTTREERPLP